MKNIMRSYIMNNIEDLYKIHMYDLEYIDWNKAGTWREFIPVELKDAWNFLSKENQLILFFNAKMLSNNHYNKYGEG